MEVRGLALPRLPLSSSRTMHDFHQPHAKEMCHRITPDQEISLTPGKSGVGECGVIINDEKERDATLPVSMTVCIAALAEDGRKAVLVADKMLTTGGVFPYQSDNGAEKILQINQNVHIMWCGGLNDSALILTKAKTRIGQRSLTTLEITQEIRAAYFEYLQEMLIAENLIGRGIPSLADFYGNNTSQLSFDARKHIENALATFNLQSNVSFIVCGKDEDGIYKIYTISSNPRFAEQIAPEGWNTIGSGEGHARFSIIHSNYNLNLLVDKVKVILKTAKRRAEKEPSVGKKTDTVILQ